MSSDEFLIQQKSPAPFTERLRNFLRQPVAELHVPISPVTPSQDLLDEIRRLKRDVR